MKKICFIVSSPLTAHSFLRGPINKLSKDYEVYLILNEKNEYKKSIKNLDVKKVFHFEILRKISVIKDIRCLIKMIYFLKKNKFDAIHSVSPKAGLIGMLAGRFALIPIRIHTFTGQVWATKKGFFRFFLKSIDRIIDSSATHILVDGKSQLKFLFENNIAINKGEILGNGSIAGISTKRFSPSIIERKKQRKKLKIPNEEWVFMFLGRLNKDKGVIDLIRAFSLLDQSINNCSLYLVGDDEEKIKEHFNSYSNKIFFIEHEKFPEKLMQACDTFCLPSYREGFGISIIEASSLKIPIICSNIYGLNETVIDGLTGMKHPVGNITKIKNKLEYALLNPSIMKKMGDNGRKYVEKNFNEASLLNAWKGFYHKNLDS